MNVIVNNKIKNAALQNLSYKREALLVHWYNSQMTT